MDLKREARRLGGAVSDGTGLSPEEMGAMVAVAVAAAGLIVALRVAETVYRLWTPSGSRA